MAGISNYERARSGELLHLTTEWLIRNFRLFDKETKIRIALIIAPKGFTEKHELSGNVSVSNPMMDAMFQDWRKCTTTGAVKQTIDVDIAPQLSQNGV